MLTLGMNRAEHQFALPPDGRTPDVLEHLAESLDLRWRRYRKRLKQCQDRFSEKAVHDSRVETRRLLATIELLRAFIPENEIKKTRRGLKDHLDTFDQLRDTQVQLVYVEGLERAFRRRGHSVAGPAGFRCWLEQRERRFTRETRKAVRRIKTKRLGRRITRFQAEIRRLHKRLPRARALATALGEMDRAFALVARRCRRASPRRITCYLHRRGLRQSSPPGETADTATIHRTRIAFRRFRYMAEALALLLPALTEQHLRAMHGYQSLMGDIQDAEVLLVALDKFAHSAKVDGNAIRLLRGELTRRRQMLIQVYLNAAGRLRRFWPVADLAHPAAGAKPKPKT